MASLSARSGLRSRMVAGKVDPASWPTSKEENQPGLWIEVDPVLAADQMEIDLRLRLVHSQMAPKATGGEGLVSRSVESGEVSIIDGRWTLLASWSHGPGRVQLVFIAANIQKLDYVRPVVKADAEPEKPRE